MGISKLKITIMKKVIGVLSLSIAFAVTSCTDKPAETKKEVIVVPAAPTKTVVVPPTPAEKPATKIVINKDGAKVATKKIDVTVNKP